MQLGTQDPLHSLDLMFDQQRTFVRTFVQNRLNPSLSNRALILIATLIVVAAMAFVPLRQYLAQQDEISALENEIAAAKQTITELEILRDRWADPAYIIAQARERLRFVKPGEVGYVSIGADGEPISGQSDTPSPATWLNRLWSSVQQSDIPPVVQVKKSDESKEVEQKAKNE